MSAVPNEPTNRPADWEAFYRDYRKPGYVSGFEITSKLGGGMFGLVFRARRMSIGKDYAIKFLQVDDEQVRKAVLGELEQVKYFAQIDHPNLVSIEDRGEVDGIPYLVMAFAGTETLRDKMPSGRAPTAAEKDELLRYFLQCCRGLAALHERSLVHFDIKPANVFLKGGVARLGDYGLSKLVTHSRGSLSMGRGTPYYMAPEMLQRRGDHRSDVYSLGVMLYELLCGQVPFTGDSEWEVLKKHETQPPELPAHLAPRERAVLQRCLAKDPAARYQSVHDLIAAFGVPASAGAAAWSDLRVGAPPPVAAPAAKPAAATPPVPPPLPPRPEDDPVAGLGRASRDAIKHASTLARKAAMEAGRIAQQAAQQAQRAVRSAVEGSRSHGMRRWRAMKRLREQRREHDAQHRTMRMAHSIARGDTPRRSWFGAVALPLGLLGGLMLLMVVLYGAHGGPRMEYALYDPAAAQPARVEASRAARWVFSRALAPPRLVEYVSLAEPDWVQTARVDTGTAREQLKERIEMLRAVAPLREDQRLQRTALPSFEMLPAERVALDALRPRVDALVRQRPYSRDLARQLAADAPLSLVIVAEQLQHLEWERTGAFEWASHLQRLLQDATGCRDLPLCGDATTPANELAAGNRQLGDLWLWFVNEFAHTPRTWQTFVQLMPPR